MNRQLCFETPEDKLRAFQKPRLVMFSEGREVESWANTQPLYFYPFSWLDYLGRNRIRELYIQDISLGLAEKEIDNLENGKVHFETLDKYLIKFAKERGHKVSLICNFEDISAEQLEALSASDFVRIRINNPPNDLRLLSGLPRDHILSCIKLYVGDGCDYRDIALQTREMGFDFLHIVKRLITNQEDSGIPEDERNKILELHEFENNRFRVITPSSLEQRFAERFIVTPRLGNVSSCDFSRYRLVLKGNSYYPCYTQQILARSGFAREGIEKNPQNCLDCACIYENDMLHDINAKMRRYKNPSFALEYIENGK